MNTDRRLEGYRQRLEEVFSGYRAEWLDKRVFELFTEPSYFPQLTASQPCFLEGGRGTGKTTALRCLSYQGQAVLRRSRNVEVSEHWPYVGMYYRINTNRVRAFVGPELKTSSWIRMFAHYINIEFCDAIAKFLQWHAQRNPNSPTLANAALRRVAETLHLSGRDTLDDLRSELDLSKLRFEATVNNIAEDDIPSLSMQGAPIDAFMSEVKKLPQFERSSFFFLIDEYENLDVPQQRVLNTLIKHCGEYYSFKVGVRELGFRERSTLNPSEQLTHPADYRLINITQELEERFSTFAADVCVQRLEQVLSSNAAVPNLSTLLPELSPEHEAVKLGVRDVVASVTEELRNETVDNEKLQTWCANAHPLEVFALSARASTDGMTNGEKLRDILRNPGRWESHYENYRYGYLFAIRRGKRGIRKYFSGWRVFCLLAASNIRYLLELVDQSLKRHFLQGLDPSQPVSHETQTRVAQDTGQKYLRELEGISLNGAKLTRLLLGLGRVFQIMAEDPVGHTPEVNQFHLDADIGDPEDRMKVEELVADGIMNLALRRYPGSKLQQQTNIRQFDYSIHPIFAAFFGFGHRRKRKIEISDRDVLDLVSYPTDAIARIVSRQNRAIDAESRGLDELPEQMKLFEGFYASNP